MGASDPRLIDFAVQPRPNEARDTTWRHAQELVLRWVQTPQDLSKEEYGLLETWYYKKGKTS